MLSDVSRTLVQETEEGGHGQAPCSQDRRREQRCGAVSDILADSDEVLAGLFYQGSDMKRVYENFPEVVFVDAIHKTNGYHCISS